MTKFTKVLLNLALLTMLFAFTLNAQDEKEKIPFNMGLYLGGNANMHNPDFNWPYQFLWTDQTGTITYDLFANINNSKNSVGWNLGLILNYPITDWIHLSGRLGYHSLNAMLSNTHQIADFIYVDEFGQPILDPFGNQIPVEADHEFDTRLGYFEISPMLKFYNLFPNPNIYLLAGLELGVAMVKEYDAYIGMVDRDFALFDFEQNNIEIPSTDLRAAVALGAGYSWKVASNTYLSPEVSFRFPFTDVSGAGEFNSWNVPQVRFGVNLTFSFKSAYDDIVAIPTTSDVNVGFSEVRYFDKQGNPNQLRRITLEETQYTEMFPIVPYVFFQENSAVPNPSVHKAEPGSMAGEFNVDKLSPDAIEINRNNMDILAWRMKETPRANITLTGTIDDQEEKGKTQLGEQRANYVKNYLVNNHNIDAGRIQTRGAAKPTKASSSRVVEGREENRRVEITSNVPELLAPITIQKDKQRIPTPDIVEFVPYAQSDDDILNWELEISQAGRAIRKFTGDGEPRPVQWTIIPNELAAGDIPVDYTFKATTVNSKSDRANGNVPVDYYSYVRKSAEERPDRTISKYSLVLFDFDSPEISAQDRDILTKQIIPSIKANSTVQVYGYSDMIGDESYNEKLAAQRANNVRDFLQSRVKDAKYETFGVGEKVKIFDNNLPTGRHLSRTVQIYVITPKN